MLHGNYSTLSKGPGRFFGGAVGTVEVGMRSGFNKPGANRNRFYIDGAATALKLYGLPQGAYVGTAWLLPHSAGAIASQNAQPSTSDATASGALGRNITGSAPSTSDAVGTGALIVSGSGTAPSTSGHSATIQAALGGSGAAPSTSGHAATLRALGWMTGVAASSSGAALVSYAVGNMAGVSTTATTLSPEGLAASLWGSAAASYNNAGTMGAKLNAAGSGGVDLDALAASVWAYTVRGLTVTSLADVRKMNGADVIGDGTVGNDWRGAGVQPQ